MRIFTAVRHANDPRRFYGNLWSSHFYPALRSLGHVVVESQTDLARTSAFMDIAGRFTPEELECRARTTEQILAEVFHAHAREPVDLFLSYFYNSHFDPAGFDDLRRLGIPSINFFCNSIHQFELVAAVAAGADISWHAERDARASYLAAGARPVWVQMGADPDVCHPVAGRVRKASACFVGQRYADRAEWLAGLIRHGIPVDVYGSGWVPGPGEQEDARNAGATAAEEEALPRTGRRHLRPGSARAYLRVASAIAAHDGPLRGGWRLARAASQRVSLGAAARLVAPRARGHAQSVPDVLADHEVCLNFSNVWADGRPGAALIPHVRLRDFEAPMCRVCYLTGYTSELEEFYELGREIDTYRTPSELVDKTRYYLSHPDAAEQLREAGYRRALRDHTWIRRFELLFSRAGLRQ